MRRALSICLMLVAAVSLAGCRRSTFWSPDGSKIALDPPSGLYVFNRRTKKFTTVKTGGAAFNPSWSPDGKSLLYYQISIKDGKLKSLDVATSAVAGGRQRIVSSQAVPEQARQQAQQNPVLKDPTKAIGLFKTVFKWMLSVDWSPDGKRIAFLGPVGNKQGGIIIARPDGSGAHPLVKSKKSQSTPVWSPDGKRIAFLEMDAKSFTFGGLPGAPSAPGAQPGQSPQAPANLVVANADGTGRRVLWDSSQRDDLWPMAEPVWARNGKEIGILTVQPAANAKQAFNFDIRLNAWAVPTTGRGAPRKQWPVTTPFAGFGPNLRSIFYLGGAKKQTLVYKTWPFKGSQLFGDLPASGGSGGAAGAGALGGLGALAGGGSSFVLPHPAIAPDGKTVAILAPAPGGKTVLRLTSISTKKTTQYPIP